MAIYVSNSFDRLSDQLLSDLTEFLPDHPLQESIVVIPWHGLQHALSLKISQHYSICANIRFFQPKQFITHILQTGENQEYFPYDSPAFIWSIYSTIILLRNQSVQSDKSDDNKKPWQTLIAQFLGENKGVDIFQFARKIFHVFDQYFAFHNDYLIQWKNNKTISTIPRFHESWQSDLFRQILQKNPQLDWEKTFQKRKYRQISAPIYLFNVHWFNQMHLHFFAKACQQYKIFQYYIASQGVLLPNQSSSLFIASNEKLIKGSFQKMNIPIEKIQFLDTENQQTVPILLAPEGRLNESSTNKKEKNLPLSDRLILRSAPSRLIEIHGLYHFILHTLKQNPDLILNDIIIYVHDIEKYAHIIDYIFNQPNYPLRHVIVGNFTSNPLWLTFNRIWQFMSEPLTRESFAQIIQIPEILAAIPIFTSEEQDIWRTWFKEAGFRFGIEGDYGIVSALERLTMSLALNFDQVHQPSSKQNIVPSSRIEGDRIFLLEKLTAFVSQVITYQKRIKKAKTLMEWLGFIEQLCQDFLSTEVAKKMKSMFDKECFSQVRRLHDLSIYSSKADKIDHETFFTAFLADIPGETAVSGQRYFTEGLCFLSLQPFHFIEKKISCIVGLHETAFPSSDQQLDFDLSQIEEYRSSSSKDRLLFLNILHNTQEKLYLSYQVETPTQTKPPQAKGQSAESQIINIMSPLLQEFVDYLQNDTANYTDSARLMCQHYSFDRFNTRYFQGDLLQNFSQENHTIAWHIWQNSRVETTVMPTNQAEENRIRLRANLLKKSAHPLTPDETLDLYQLNALFSDPHGFYLQRNFAMQQSKIDGYPQWRIDQEAAFPPDGYSEQSNIVQELDRHLKISQGVEKKEFIFEQNKWIEYLHARGLIAPQNLGAYHVQDFIESHRFYNQVVSQANLTAVNLPVDFHGTTIKILGWISGFLLNSHVLVLTTLARKISPKILLKTWFNHLFSSCHFKQSEMSTYCCSMTEDTCFAYFCEKNEGEKFLLDLLSLIPILSDCPLPYFPEISFGYSKHLFGKLKKNNADLLTVENQFEKIKHLRALCQVDADFLRVFHDDWLNPVDDEFGKLGKINYAENLLWHQKNPFAPELWQDFHDLSLKIFLPIHFSTSLGQKIKKEIFRF